jgi:putative endonuclease
MPLQLNVQLAETLGGCSSDPIGPRTKLAMPDQLATVPCPAPAPGLFWVYILQSADSTLYIGQTSNLPERLRKHRLGLGSKHTHDHGLPRLVYCEGPLPLVEAVQRERQLKRWTRAKKEALIRGDRVVLPQLRRSTAARPTRT